MGNEPKYFTRKKVYAIMNQRYVRVADRGADAGHRAKRPGDNIDYIGRRKRLAVCTVSQLQPLCHAVHAEHRSRAAADLDSGFERCSGAVFGRDDRHGAVSSIAIAIFAVAVAIQPAFEWAGGPDVADAVYSWRLAFVSSDTYEVDSFYPADFQSRNHCEFNRGLGEIGSPAGDYQACLPTVP